MTEIARTRAELNEQGGALTAAAPKHSVPRWVITLGSMAFFLLAWEFFGRGVNPVFGSYPSAIALAFVELIRSGKIWVALLESLQPFALGYGLAVLIGVPLGLVIGRFWI